ncbi:MAG: hypothetical protein B7C24_11275 [Bacteroidetes bacterium 4572_77]|nr:MAG: hypothetical protein B7C24_11275 [Bacteroidetes bacterium 4572_77]
MKKIGIIFAIVLLFTSASIFAQNNNTESKTGPKLVFDCGSTFDWGDVKYNESPLHCTVKLINTGTELLKITKVKPGCGCTKQKLDKDEIAPGDTASLELKLNLNNRPGKITKSVSVFTNVPDKEKYVMFLKANVKTGYRITPSQLRFFNVAIDEETSSKVVLQNTSVQDLVVDSIRIRPNDIIVSGIEKGQVIKPDESIPVEVKVTPKKLGRFTPTVTVYFKDHPDVTKIQIYGRGKAVEPEVKNGSEQVPTNQK